MKKYNVSLLKTKKVRTAFHLSLSNRFKPLDQLENTDTSIATFKLSGSISARCGVAHVKKSFEEESLSTKKIRRTINMLKNGKAAGLDEIPAEAIKADTETSVSILFNLFKKIWDEEGIPEEWKKGIRIKLSKKGDLRECSNYRGIMLLSVPGKVLKRILLEIVSKAVDPKLRI
nr:uncharacterized protein LOC117683441 [Crassostrea gigas]